MPQKSQSIDTAADANVNTAETDTLAETDLVWGAEAIGKLISRTASQVRYLYSIGFFDSDTVWKAAHKTIVGSRKRLLAGDGFKRLPPPDQTAA
jgi:hypothetical protein